MAIIFSFLGFLLDNLINLIKTGIINNDSFVLPFNASYGFMAFLFYFIGSPSEPAIFGIRLIKKKNKWSVFLSHIVYFIVLYVLILGGGIAIGYFWHFTVQAEIFDYSAWPFHITKYAEMFTSLGMTLFFYLFLRFIYHPMLNILKEKHKPNELIGGVVFYIILLIDLIYGWIEIIRSEQLISRNKHFWFRSICQECWYDERINKVCFYHITVWHILKNDFHFLHSFCPIIYKLFISILLILCLV
jgi:hypothetical protein